jgi:hypothetical protein
MNESEQRDQVLRQAVDALKRDSRITGVVLVGSGAHGFIDEYSDIDLLAIAANSDAAEQAYRDWELTVRRLFPVLHHARSPFTEANRLHVFILEGLLELDTSFTTLSSVVTRRGDGRVVFDRTGAVDDRWKHAKLQEIRLRDHLTLFDQACHRVMECRKSLHRGNIWQASLVLDELRSCTTQIASLIYIGSIRQRDIDRLPQAFLVDLSSTVVPVEGDRIVEALRQLAALMFTLSEQLYARAGAEFPSEFASALLVSLDAEKGLRGEN